MTPSHFHPVYAVIGTDRFMRADVLGPILDLLKSDGDTLGPTRVDGNQALLADVLDELRTPSLLGDRRVVIVDDADPFVSLHRMPLERYCENPASTGSLILLCKSMPRSTRLHKAICRCGSVIVAEVPKGRALLSWLRDRSEKVYAKPLHSTAAQRLLDLLGAAMGTLDSELAKLAAYVGDRAEITSADVDALTGHLREENVFAILDAIATHDTESALRHWELVLATDRAAPGRAIGGLAYSVRQLLAAQRDFASGVSISTLAEHLPINPGQLKRRLERTSSEALERQQRDLLAADLAVKTGASTLGRAVEAFIVNHSQSDSMGR